MRKIPIEYRHTALLTTKATPIRPLIECETEDRPAFTLLSKRLRDSCGEKIAVHVEPVKTSMRAGHETHKNAQRRESVT